MLRIRAEQMEILRAPLVHRIVLNLVAHARQHFPEQCAAQSDQELYEQMADTVRRAEKYDITSERDLHKYVNITMVYGPGFDEQDETAWTVAYLTDPVVVLPSRRIDRLHEEVIYRLEVEENNTAIERGFYGNNEDETI